MGRIEEGTTTNGVLINAGIKLFTDVDVTLKDYPDYLKDSFCYPVPYAWVSPI